MYLPVVKNDKVFEFKSISVTDREVLITAQNIQSDLQHAPKIVQFPTTCGLKKVAQTDHFISELVQYVVTPTYPHPSTGEVVCDISVFV